VKARALVTAAQDAWAAEEAANAPPPGPDPAEVKLAAHDKVIALIGSAAESDTTADKWEEVDGLNMIKALVGNIQFLYMYADDSLWMLQRSGDRFQVETLAGMGRLFKEYGPRTFVGELSA
jgi:hypothetical protein